MNILEIHKYSTRIITIQMIRKKKNYKNGIKRLNKNNIQFTCNDNSKVKSKNEY